MTSIAQQFPTGTIIMNRAGTERGYATGNTKWYGGLDAGERPEVRWTDGRRTFPHPTGIRADAAGTLRIA